VVLPFLRDVSVNNKTILGGGSPLELLGTIQATKKKKLGVFVRFVPIFSLNHLIIVRWSVREYVQTMVVKTMYVHV